MEGHINSDISLPATHSAGGYLADVSEPCLKALVVPVAADGQPGMAAIASTSTSAPGTASERTNAALTAVG